MIPVRASSPTRSSCMILPGSASRQGSSSLACSFAKTRSASRARSGFSISASLDAQSASRPNGATYQGMPADRMRPPGAGMTSARRSRLEVAVRPPNSSLSLVICVQRDSHSAPDRASSAASRLDASPRTAAAADRRLGRHQDRRRRPWLQRHLPVRAHAARVELDSRGPRVELDDRLPERLVLADIGQHQPALQLLGSERMPARLPSRPATHLEDVGEVGGQGERDARRDRLAQEVEHAHEVIQAPRGDHQLTADAQRLLRHRRQPLARQARVGRVDDRMVIDRCI